MTANATQVDARELRRFGISIGAVVGVLFGLILPWLFSAGFPWWPWIVAGGLVAWGIVWPRGLGMIYGPWMRFAHVIGTFNGRVLLTIVFFLLIFPFGVIMRLLGKDPMARRLDRSAMTYRVKVNPSPKNHMEKPY